MQFYLGNIRNLINVISALLQKITVMNFLDILSNTEYLYNPLNGSDVVEAHIHTYIHTYIYGRLFARKTYLYAFL
jgi:hypothetical protein